MDDLFDGVSGGLRNFIQGAMDRRRDGYVRAPNSIFTPGHDALEAASNFVAAQNAPYGSIAYRNDPTQYGSVASRQMPGQFGTYGSFNLDNLANERAAAQAEQNTALSEARKQEEDDRVRQSALTGQYTAQALTPLFQKYMSGAGRRPTSGFSHSPDEDSING